MSDKEEATTNESQEQGEQQTESAVEDFGDVVETQESEVVGDIKDVKEAAIEDVSRIEENGLPEEVQEMGDIAERTTEEAEDAKEEYEEQIKSIPNFDDKVEAIKKEVEAKEEYEEKLKDIPNASDLTESFKAEESVEAVAEETKESSAVVEAKTEKTDENPENEKSCPKCGALFSGTANFCGKCGTELGETETEKVEEVEKVSEVQQSETTEAGERKDGQLFDRLSELDVSMEAINMEDQEAAIKKIDDASSDLDSFIIDNQEAIGNNQELETIVNAVRDVLKEAKSMIEKRGDGAQEIEEDTKAFMKDRLDKLEEDGLGDDLEARYIKRKLGQDQKENKSLKEDEKSEEPSVSKEIEEESPVEDYQYTYDQAIKDIEDVLSSNKDPYEKRKDLDHIEELLKSSHDNFIPDDILEDEDVREMIENLKNKFNIARSTIEESKTEEEKKADARKAVNFAVQNIDKSLDILKTSEESPSGKTSALIGASGSLDNTYKKYKDIIDSDGELKMKLNDAIKKVKIALEEQEKLQAKNDKLANNV